MLIMGAKLLKKISRFALEKHFFCNFATENK